MLAISDMDPVVCELELRKLQKEHSNGVIQRLRIKPTSKSCFSIPLSRLRVLPLVRPINEVDVQRLECEFVMGYREGDRVMYVSVFNDILVDLPVSPAIMASWSPLWQEASAEFDVKLKKDPDLHISVGRCSSFGKEIIDSQHGGGTSTTTTPMRRVGMSGWIVWWSTPRVAPVSSSTP